MLSLFDSQDCDADSKGQTLNITVPMKEEADGRFDLFWEPITLPDLLADIPSTLPMHFVDRREHISPNSGELEKSLVKGSSVTLSPEEAGQDDKLEQRVTESIATHQQSSDVPDELAPLDLRVSDPNKSSVT